MSTACGRPSNDKNAGDGREPSPASSNLTVADSPPNICSPSSGSQTRNLTNCTTNRGNSSLLPSKPQGSQRSQKQSLQTPFPIPAATEPTQQQQQPSEQPPQQQKSPPQPETWPQAVTAHQQGAAGDDETEGAIRAESQGPGRCLRSNLSVARHDSSPALLLSS